MNAPLSTDERLAGEPETAETVARQPDVSAASSTTRSRRQIDGGALALSHTPGPWWVERRAGDALQVNAKHRGEGSSYCVASVNHWEGEADRANARLIAAAPDLLAALKRLLATQYPGTENHHETGCRCVIHEAQVAIAKAEGQS